MFESEQPPKANGDDGHHTKCFTFVFDPRPDDPQAIGVILGPRDQHGNLLLPIRQVAVDNGDAEFRFSHPGRKIIVAADHPLLMFLRGSKLFRAPTYWEIQATE
jgi:hypothetical protein